jgi:hypothetical protein
MSGYLTIGGRIILKWILRETGCGGMNWIDLTLVNNVMNLNVM